MFLPHITVGNSVVSNIENYGSCLVSSHAIEFKCQQTHMVDTESITPTEFPSKVDIERTN